MNPEESCKSHAKAVLIDVAKHIGPGFHPDTEGADYVKVGTSEKSFTADEARFIDKAIDFAFDVLGEEGIYEALEEAGLMGVSWTQA